MRLALGTSVLAGLSLLCFLIWSGYQEAVHLAEITTRDYAGIIEARLESTLRRVEGDLRILSTRLPIAAVDEGGAHRYALEVNADLRLQLSDFPEVTGLRITDANGERLYTSDSGNPPRTNLADRAYFKELRDNPQVEIVYSDVLVGRIGGRPSVIVARALRDGQGVFRGVLLAVLELDYFERLFQTLNLGAKGNVAIYRSDSFRRVMRWPRGDGESNTPLPPDSPTRAALAGGAKVATIEIASAADGVRRIYSYHVLDRRPFFVSVGIAHDDALAAWRVRSLLVGSAALLIAGLVFGLRYRLRRAEALRGQLATIVAQSNDAILSRSTDGTILSWNGGAERMLGYTAAEMIGRNSIGSGPLGGLPDTSSEQLLRDATGGAEAECITRDGRAVNVVASHSPLRDEKGNICGSSLILQDVTERRRLESQLRIERERLRIIVETVGEPIFVKDDDHRIVFANRAFLDLFRLDEDAVIGTTLAEHVTADERRRFLAVDRLVLDSGMPDVREETITVEGATRTIVTRKTRFSEGDGSHFLVGAIHDISERKLAEVAIVDARERLSAIIDASLDAIISVSDDERIVVFNKTAEKMFGFSAAEMLGQTVDRFIPAGLRSRHRGHLREFARGGATVRAMGRYLPLHAVRRDGTEFPIEAAISRTVGAQGQLHTVTIRDVSERMRAEAARASLEAQLRESQKMEAVGTLAGGIAHDFNNIIAAIIGNVELAYLDAHSDPLAVQESIGEIRKAAQRARDIVQHILAFSRRQPTDLRSTALGEVIDESVRLLRATLPARIALEVHSEPDVPPARADATQIEQVIINLVTNAMQAMGGGSGHIDIRLDAVLLDEKLAGTDLQLSELRGERTRRMLRLVVRDTGPGMDAAIVNRIFDPFFTTKPVGEGTGLGLSVVHGILRAHEGAIVVESQIGKGATFTLYLPIATALDGARAAEAGAALPAPGSPGGQHILYVDDDEAMLNVVARLLDRGGYRVSTYVDQDAALAALRADPASFDLVVTDYNMPKMSGLDVARMVRTIRADLPVALISGFVDQDLRAQAAEAGVRELIFKAADVGVLAETLARLMKADSRDPKPS